MNLETERTPAGRGASISLGWLAAALILSLTAVAWIHAEGSKAAVGDPVGDTFGTGSAPIDATHFSARTGDGELVVAIAFATTIAPPSSGAANAVAGFIDLDVDADAATGNVAFVDFLTDLESGTGSDFYVDLLSYRGADGQVDLVAADGTTTGRVPMNLSASSLEVSIPLELLGVDDAIRTTAIVGNAAEATDALPDGGFLQSTATGDTVLLNRDRFAVTVDWRDHTGTRGSGQLAVRSDDSAIFWFFNANNWELMVKVLNGCGANQHFWVFAAATTDVEYTLTVTDTVTGAVRTYFNPLGIAAPATTDISAFNVCS